MVNEPLPHRLQILQLAQQPYQAVWQQMQTFTAERTASTPDQLWLLEHDPVFTQGRAGKAQHLIDVGSIPLVQSDRGGQITYHGPGQLITYWLIDLPRRQLSVRQLIQALEQSALDTLAHFGIHARTCAGAPGVYVGALKIGSLGLRISHGCSLHGFALNVNMDLRPFAGIHPCGDPHLQLCQMADWIPAIKLADVQAVMLHHARYQLGDRSGDRSPVAPFKEH